MTAILRWGVSERSRVREKKRAASGGDRERERERAGRKTRKKKPHDRSARGGCENAEKRVASEGGTRVDRVAKTTGSQVIIKCNQYFTYFSREAEGRLTITTPFSWLPYKFLRSPFFSDLETSSNVRGKIITEAELFNANRTSSGETKNTHTPLSLSLTRIFFILRHS